MTTKIRKPGPERVREVWVDIDEADPDTMQIVFAQYRNKVLAELCQIKNDLDHYNENRNKGGKPLVFIFDFSDDIAEWNVIGRPKDYTYSGPTLIKKIADGG